MIVTITLTQLTFTYNADGKLTEVTDPIGRSVSFGYNAADNLNDVTSVTDPLGRHHDQDLRRQRQPADHVNAAERNQPGGHPGQHRARVRRPTRAKAGLWPGREKASQNFEKVCGCFFAWTRGCSRLVFVVAACP